MSLMNTRTLTQVLDAEAAAVTAGTAVACAAPSLDPTIANCARTASHPVDGEAARESHASRNPLTVDDPAALSWVTWTD